ncbi:DUF5050 domain-containing protein [candidate division KSB1 bacterium]|nr:PD40 domain-containing protein [candidate division KSB1 bacterium]RQW05039.1 MAG: DUF5050 domain-containing protein [candidate division KSB1 bacterium]
MLRSLYFALSFLLISSVCLLQCSKKSPSEPTPENQSNPDPPQKTYKIAYASSQEFWEVYIMNLDGSNLKRLTYHETISADPAWSPDGTKIAYRTWENGTSANVPYVMDADGSNPKKLTESKIDVGYIRWSPKGDRIAIVDRSERIFVIKPDGTDEKALDTNCWGPAKWSPDGSKLVFRYDLFFDEGIGIIHADGTNFALISDSEDDWEPDWSPDGKRIAFASNRDGNYEIYTMDPTGANLKRLTNNEAEDSWPIWSPDGSKIAFDSNRDDELYEIYVMNADGSNPKRVTNVPRYIFYHTLSWTPDGKIVFVEAEDRNGCSHCDIWIVNADGTNQKKLTENESIDCDPACSPVPVL